MPGAGSPIGGSPIGATHVLEDSNRWVGTQIRWVAPTGGSLLGDHRGSFPADSGRPAGWTAKDAVTNTFWGIIIRTADGTDSAAPGLLDAWHHGTRTMAPVRWVAPIRQSQFAVPIRRNLDGWHQFESWHQTSPLDGWHQFESLAPIRVIGFFPADSGRPAD